MKNLNVKTLFFAYCLSCVSCTYVYYPNYPVITEAKEQKIGIQGIVSLSKAQLSSWYGIDSNFFVIATVSGALSWVEQRSTDSNNHKRYNSLAATAGMGYQKKFGEKGHFQIIGGGGIVQSHLLTTVFNPDGSNNILNPVDVRTLSTRFYLQPSIGSRGEKSGIFFIPRLTFENFVQIQPTVQRFNVPMRKQNYVLLDPFLMGKFKSDNIDICIYGGVSFVLASSSLKRSDDDILVAQPFTLGFGISHNF